MGAALSTVRVPFHGTDLVLMAVDGHPYTAMRPVVEGMGLSWAAQTVKLNSNPRWGVSMIETPTNSQPMLCLPLRKLPGWLMTIQTSRVRPELREKIRTFQNECDDVLWDYWAKGYAERPLGTQTPLFPAKPEPRPKQTAADRFSAGSYRLAKEMDQKLDAIREDLAGLVKLAKPRRIAVPTLSLSRRITHKEFAGMVGIPEIVAFRLFTMSWPDMVDLGKVGEACDMDVVMGLWMAIPDDYKDFYRRCRE